MKHGDLSTVASHCEWRADMMDGFAQELQEVLENRRYCTKYQEFFRPIHDPWGRTFMNRLAQLYRDQARQLRLLADEAMVEAER